MRERNEEGSAIKVMCIDQASWMLEEMKQTVLEIVPKAEILLCKPSEAVRVAGNRGCDVLLTDIDLGREHDEGLILAQKIRELCPRVNIIFTTVCAPHEYTERVLRLRPSGYVRVPCNTKRLAKEFQNLRYTVPLRTEARWNQNTGRG